MLAALPMGEASLGIFSIVLDLPDGAEFKFLPTMEVGMVTGVQIKQ